MSRIAEHRPSLGSTDDVLRKGCRLRRLVGGLQPSPPSRCAAGLVGNTKAHEARIRASFLSVIVSLS